MPHPSGVAASEIVVNRNQLDILAGKRIQIQRQCRNQRLAFASLHFGNLALMQHYAANELHIKRNHVPGERVPTNFLRRTHQFAASVFHKRIGFRKDFVQRLAGGDTILEFLGDARKILVGEVLCLIFRFYPVNLPNDRIELFQLSIIFGAK